MRACIITEIYLCPLFVGARAFVKNQFGLVSVPVSYAAQYYSHDDTHAAGYGYGCVYSISVTWGLHLMVTSGRVYSICMISIYLPHNPCMTETYLNFMCAHLKFRLARQRARAFAGTGQWFE